MLGKRRFAQSPAFAEQSQRDKVLRSLLMQERGLKRYERGHGKRSRSVAPHAGAWIETPQVEAPARNSVSLLMQERGLKLFRAVAPDRRGRSLLMQERGLKHHHVRMIPTKTRSLLMQERGLKREAAQVIQGLQDVAPHAGAWIETS